jgi:uncharacterized protein (UPF0305 family)
MDSNHLASNKQDSLTLAPHLGPLRERFINFCKKVEREFKQSGLAERAEVFVQIRDELARDHPVQGEDLELLFVNSVILDLVAQGWDLSVTKKDVTVKPPESEGHAAKETVRNGHLLGRDAQLRERSVLDFIRNMERRRLYANGWHSIFSLMRDGRDLAEKIEEVRDLEDDSAQLQALSHVIAPYIQFVEGDAVCEHTGLRLGDIWRYFRHTWVNEYKSIPGRSTMILIRDAAAPNHPVIGIAALGSSVVQHRVRDEWIGWQSDIFVKLIEANPTRKIAKWLSESLKHLISEIYIKDLLAEGILTRRNISHPMEEIIERLLRESDRAIRKHRQNPQKKSHKGQKEDDNRNAYWEQEARTYLYRSKRCKQLAKLLSIRRIFDENEISSGLRRNLQIAIQRNKVRGAVAQLVRMMKARHVGVDMMDITVCGAIAPYNALLGGKLVCMLLCSPEVTEHYAKKYGDQVSIIASSMRGKPVVRKPNLVLLCTTSLYGVGSSQYNRVKIPLDEVGGNAEESVVYEDLGHSYGFGTYHFSKETIRLGDTLISRRKNGRLVNSIFGEGVNPLMRKIREALEIVGLRSDELLLHGNRRVTYGIRLARNFREILLGIDARPKYLINRKSPKKQTQRIGAYWLSRWLSKRITRPGILEEVAKHTLTYPIRHGAVVSLPDAFEEAGTLLNFER